MNLRGSGFSGQVGWMGLQYVTFPKVATHRLGRARVEGVFQ
jgi:hypothetical protein